MTVRVFVKLMFCLVVPAAILAACTPPYSIQPPKSFKRFEQSRDFRYITPDGVMLKGREVDNYPRGELDFWTDALKRHLDARGYVLKSKTCFKTEKQLDQECRLATRGRSEM